MSVFVMSDKYTCFLDEMKKLGHTVIPSETVNSFSKPEQKHADMQILPLNDKIFILKECTMLAKRLDNKNVTFCKKRVGRKYPENILLNFLYLNNTIYGNISIIDNNLLDYCEINSIRTVNVNQGYARCSTLVLNSRAAITSDLSIAKALKKGGVEVLLISPGNIVLEGYNYGFIGGASGKIDNNTVVFFGNIKNHPDYFNIVGFCNKHDISIKTICKNLPLTDIGGIVKIK